MIVEDEIALDLKRMLIERGYLITGICDTGEGAIRAILNQKPDLILMDILLKGKLNGIETAGNIQKN